MTLDRKTPPPYNPIEQVKLFSPELEVLPNGIHLYYLDLADADLLRVEFIFNNPQWEHSNPMLISAGNSLLNMGTERYTSAEIADKIDYYGSFYQHEVGFDQASITLYSLNHYLENTLPIVKEIITNAIFPQQELETYIKTGKQKLQVNLEKNDFVARKKFSSILFGDYNYYGHNIQLEDYDKLTVADLQRLKNSQYKAENCTIIVSGKVKESERQLIKVLFGGKDWTSEQAMPTMTFDFTPSETHKHLIEKPESVQSAIRLGKRMINKNHEDFIGLQVLNTVLGGYFGSRLMANIREDKGYTYGIGSSVVSLKDAGYFFVATQVGADVCSNALTEIYKEIELLKTDIIPEEELSLVRNYMLGALLGSVENAFSQADKFKSLYFYGLDYSYYDRLIDTVKHITSAELQALANKYFSGEWYEVVVGKK